VNTTYGVYFPVQEQEAALFVVVSLPSKKTFLTWNGFCKSCFQFMGRLQKITFRFTKQILEQKIENIIEDFNQSQLLTKFKHDYLTTVENILLCFFYN
jgi:hypothetical protein